MAATCITLQLQAGEQLPSTSPMPASPSSGSIFDHAQRPISNPTLFDLPLARTQVHAIYMHHRFPNQLRLAGGGNVPVGGEANIFALQLEYAINDEFSIVAAKDGYADVNFDNTLSDGNGFANLAAGARWVFHRNEQTGYAAAITGLIELPTGNRDIFQGEGDGALNLIFSNLKVAENWQLASSFGLQLPFHNNEEATMGFASAHASYKLTSWFQPLVELNWFHVIKSGNGSNRFPGQLGGAVPAAISFEGGDLFNIGSAAAGENRNFVTLALGARFPINNNVALGAAYEIPLTNDRASLMRDRFTVDLVYRF